LDPTGELLINIFRLYIGNSGLFYHDHVPGNLFIVPYLNRKSGNSFSLNLLTQLAEFFTNSSYISFKEQKLQKFNTSTITSINNNSIGLIDLLIHRNILKLHGDHLRFTNPSILCQLLALSENYQPSKDINALIHSPIDNLASLYSKADRKYLSSWIDNLNFSDGRQISITLNHLFFDNSSIPDISSAYPKIAKLLISPSLPLSIKIKIASIIYYTNQVIFCNCSQNYSRLEIPKRLSYALSFMGFFQKTSTVQSSRKSSKMDRRELRFTVF